MSYNINLIWTQDPFIAFADIWNGWSIKIEHNGDNDDPFYNVFVHDSKGNERDTIDGDKTLNGAKQNAEKWVIEQCKEFLTVADDIFNH